MIIISKNKRPPSFQGLFNLEVSGFLKTILLLHYYSWDFAMGVLGSQLGKVNCFLDLLRNSNLSLLLFTSLMQILPSSSGLINAPLGWGGFKFEN